MRSMHAQDTTRGPVAAPAGVRPSPIAIADSAAPFHPSAGCQAVRGTLLGSTGYVGYLAGELAAFPVAYWDARAANVVGVGLGAAGAVAGVLLGLDAPLQRRMPLCPRALHTISGRSDRRARACTAGRVIGGLLGASTGAMMAGASVVADPTVLLTNGDAARRHTSALALVLPIAGAVSGSIAAGRVSPCRVETPLPTTAPA